jgi:hypothetical protein
MFGDMQRRNGQCFILEASIIALLVVMVVSCTSCKNMSKEYRVRRKVSKTNSVAYVSLGITPDNWRDEIKSVRYFLTCSDSADSFVAFGKTNFSDAIEPAMTITESKERFEARKIRIIVAAANTPMPPKRCHDKKNSFPDNADLNLDMDSRRDVVYWASNGVARILAGLPNPELESILTNPQTKQFSNVGISSSGNLGFLQCDSRPADYDFALIDLLNLYFVAREYDPKHQLLSNLAMGSFSVGSVRGSGLRGLLVGGRIFHYPYLQQVTYDLLNCKVPKHVIMRKKQIGSWVKTLWNQPVTLTLEDTENHVLQTGIGLYLTNEIMLETGKNQTLIAIQSKNKRFLLKRMGAIARTHFYEYNSKPYQQFTIHALTTLFSYCNDTQLRNAAKSLLDIASLWTAVGSNNMRRFVPFRRQTRYALSSDSSDDPEFSRFATLVGNYGLNYDLVRSNPQLLFTASGKYRLPDTILELAIKGESIDVDYFRGYHSVPEVYAYSRDVLISSGGVSSAGLIPNIHVGIRNQSLSIFRCKVLKKYVEKWMMDFVKDPSYDTSNEENLLSKEFGWARPTVVIPSREVATSWTDMVRFEGDRSLEAAVKGHNMCVAPGFACGYQLLLPNK